MTAWQLSTPADRLIYADWLAEQGRERDSALQRILAEPAEDAHRLLYADACEREGDMDRAEFVRVQVELAATAKRGHDPRKHTLPDYKYSPPRFVSDSSFQSDCSRCMLERRERELLTTYDRREVKWFNDLIPPRSAWQLRPHTYCRGFVSEITCTWFDWTMHHRVIRAWTPLELVRLETWPDYESFIRATGRPSEPRPIGLLGPPLDKVLSEAWPGIEFELPLLPDGLRLGPLLSPRAPLTLTPSPG